MTDKQAADHRYNAYEIYQAHGAWAVEEYADNIGLDYSWCLGCESETPTLTDSKGSECLVCGQHKDE